MGPAKGGTSGSVSGRRRAVFGFGGPAGVGLEVCGPVVAGAGVAVCWAAVCARTGRAAALPARAAVKFRRFRRLVVFALLILTSLDVIENGGRQQGPRGPSPKRLLQSLSSY